MFIVTLSFKQHPVIKAISQIATEVNGNLNVGYAVLGNTSLYSVHEVTEVPDGISENKFCYSVKKGFYPTPYYTEESETNSLKSEVEELTLLIAEIIAEGV